LSTRKSASAKKAGRPPKEPPKGTLGWRIRDARKKRGLEPPEVAEWVGLKTGMISAGELHSNFSPAVLRLLAMLLRDNFGEKELTPYAEEGKILQIYRSMTPEARRRLKELKNSAASGNLSPFPTDSEDD